MVLVWFSLVAAAELRLVMAPGFSSCDEGFTDNDDFTDDDDEESAGT